MQIKRFEAKDVQEALRQVKEAMGPEAIILSTKTIKSPSRRFGFSQSSMVEVVAAIDRGVDPPAEPSQMPPSSGSPREPREPDQGLFDDEAILRRMLSAGIYPEFALHLTQEIQTLRENFGGSNLLEVFQGYLRWKLMEAVDVTGPAAEGTKIWAFIGPTGVGKTTTLAKLAAQFSLRVTKKITLITIDTYRIGAIEQLKTYAEILKLPLEVALHRDELREVIERNIHQDLLLIDTMGRSPNDQRNLEELKDFLMVHPQIENHLLLSATTKDKDLAQAVQQFSLLPIKSYIFTKIDETGEYGPLFNQLLRYKKPLSYLTHGQKVPEDIELATKVRVANLILNTISWN